MLTVPEAARRAGKNPETIRRWIREGKLRARKIGQQHMIADQDLDTIVAARSRRIGEGPVGYAIAAVAQTTTNEWLPAIVGRLVRATNPARILVSDRRVGGAIASGLDVSLIVVIDEVPDPTATQSALQSAVADLPVVAEIHVVSAPQAAGGDTGAGRQVLLEGREVYSREMVRVRSVLEQLIDSGRATPPRHPDTSVLPARWPSTNGITATDALIAERRDDPR